MPTSRPRFTFRQLEKWPEERTPSRQYARFKNKDGKIDLDRNVRELEYELGLLKVDHAEVHVGIEGRYFRRDGWPMASAPVAHPGVVLTYSHPKFGMMRIQTDRFTHWVDNLRAIVITLENLRQMDRYGTTGNGKQYEGFRQLPASTAPTMGVERAAEIVREHGKSKLSVEVILREREVADMVSTAARFATHPDRNPGKADAHDVFHLVEQARQVLSAHHGGL
jgi:hypothetical protein